MLTSVILQAPWLLSGFPLDTYYFSVYRPIYYGIAYVADAGEQVSHLLISVCDANTNQVISSFYHAYQTRFTAGLNEVFYFKVDISLICQKLVAPFGGDLSNTFFGDNSTCKSSVYIKYQAIYVPAGNIYVISDITVNDTSDNITYICNSTATSDLVYETAGIELSYIGTLMSGQYWKERGNYVYLNAYWLTDTPINGNSMCLDYLTYLSYSSYQYATILQYVVIKPDGTTTTTNAAFNAPNSYISVISSWSQINDLYGTDIQIGDTYSVNIMFIFGAGLSHIIPGIYIKAVECCEPLRKSICISFLNKYGVSDSVLLNGDISKILSVSSDTANVPLKYSQTTHSFNSDGAGLVRTETSSTQGFIININISNKYALWLRDLLKSPEVYYNIPYNSCGSLDRKIRINVLDISENIINKSGKSLVQMQIKCIFANSDVSQRV